MWKLLMCALVAAGLNSGCATADRGRYGEPSYAPPVCDPAEEDCYCPAGQPCQPYGYAPGTYGPPAPYGPSDAYGRGDRDGHDDDRERNHRDERRHDRDRGQQHGSRVPEGRDHHEDPDGDRD